IKLNKELANAKKGIYTFRIQESVSTKDKSKERVYIPDKEENKVNPITLDDENNNEKIKPVNNNDEEIEPIDDEKLENHSNKKKKKWVTIREFAASECKLEIQIKQKTFNKEIDEIVFFVDGPGGYRKIFLFNMILVKIIANNQTAIAAPSSGIAALLLDSERTAYSRFKILIKLTEISTLDIVLHLN
ncbi:4722_t:CDS:2, partial [Funneliformis caledonium]